jgi:hypothetical protein
MESMIVRRSTVCVTLVLIALSASAAAAQMVPPPTGSVTLSGPRVGLTHLDEGVRAKLLERNLELESTLVQFGWQFEKQFYSKSGGLTALNEWVVLVGGLEQGVALPSVSWLVGLRSSGGSEFGFGPNITPAGVALALAAGTTFQTGAMNVPVNVAVVPSKAGLRVSVLTGFSLRR